MAELFERHNKENSDADDEVVMQGSFQDLVNKDWSWAEFYDFVGDKIVWTAPDCSVVKRDPPPDHEYSVDVICQMDKNQKQKLQVTGTSEQATASTLNGLLQLCDKNPQETDLTFKCFATNPRTPLGTLQNMTSPTSKIDCLRFHFVALDEDTTGMLLTSGVSDVEFRQCTVDGLDASLLANQGPPKLAVSCNMPELAKFSSGLAANSTVKDLDLLLHFWLQGTALTDFANALSGNLGLERLSISYLEINDDGWISLCEALHQHPNLKKIELGYTEKFADTFRKLTPERRTARSKAVLDLVQANSSIQDIVWPKFQQDESIMTEINDRLQRNRT
jgi:hypothetical protein